MFAQVYVVVLLTSWNQSCSRIRTRSRSRFGSIRIIFRTTIPDLFLTPFLGPKPSSFWTRFWTRFQITFFCYFCKRKIFLQKNKIFLKKKIKKNTKKRVLLKSRKVKLFLPLLIKPGRMFRSWPRVRVFWIHSFCPLFRRKHDILWPLFWPHFSVVHKFLSLFVTFVITFLPSFLTPFWAPLF